MAMYLIYEPAEHQRESSETRTLHTPAEKRTNDGPNKRTQRVDCHWAGNILAMIYEGT